MKNLAFFFFFLFPTIAFAQTAYELRAPMGAAFVKPTELNEAQPSALKILYGGNFGADFIVDFESYGVGLRFDSLSAVRADGGQKNGDAIEVASHVFSLLGRKRWDIDERRYVGVNATGAVYAPSYVNTHGTPGSPWVQYKNENLGYFSAAGEGGFFWNPFVVGVELGYQYIVLKDLKTDQGVQLANAGGKPIDVDLSGPYIKVLLGLRF